MLSIESSSVTLTCTTESDAIFIMLPDETLEESFFDITCSPVAGILGKPEGVIVQVLDRSRENISLRRLGAISKLSDALAKVENFDETFWNAVLTSMDQIPMDAPFIAVYKCNKAACCFSRVGCLGLSDDRIAAPRFSIRRGDYGCSSCFFADDIQKAARTRAPVIHENFSLSEEAQSNVGYRGFSEIPKHAAILPIFTSFGSLEGFVLLGLNPRRAIDDGCRIWLEKWTRELRMNAERIVLLQKERSRSEESEKLMKLSMLPAR